MFSVFREMESRHRTRERRQFSGAAPSPSPPLPPPPYHLHQQQAPHHPPIHQRLSSVDESLRRYPLPPAPLDHSDYNSAILAYHQRVNAHPSRNQPPFWSSTDRPNAFRNSETNRLPSEDVSSHSRQPSLLSRDYREIKDDLRSLSELDSIRRSAALSANIFLDERRLGRSAIRRDGVYESPPTEVSHYHVRQDEVMHIPPLIRDSTERLRKRMREEEIDFVRDRSSRYKRFCDPGLSVLPRTPETSRNHPLVRRVLASGLVTREPEGREKNYNRLFSTAERRPSPFVVPSKSSKKRKTPKKVADSDGCRASSLTTRSKEIEKKSQKIRQCYSETSRDKPNTIPVTEDDLGGEDRLRVKRDENLAGTASRSGVSKDEKAMDECSPNKGARRFYESTQEPSRIIKTSPQNKNIESRSSRLIGIDAKVRRDSTDSTPKMQDIAVEVEGKKSVCPREFGNDSTISNVAHEISLPGKKITEQKVTKDLQTKQPLFFNVDLPQAWTLESTPQLSQTFESTPIRSQTLESTPRCNQTLGPVFHDENAVHPALSEEGQCIEVSEMPLHVTNEELTPSQPRNCNSSSEILGCPNVGGTRSTTDLETPHTIASQQEEPLLQKQKSQRDITSESPEINGREMKDFFPVILNSTSSMYSELPFKSSVNGCSEYNLYATCAPEKSPLNMDGDVKSLCDVTSMSRSLSSPLLYHPKDPILILGKEIKSDSELPVSNMYKNNTQLQDIEGTREMAIKREEEREVRLFGKSLKTSIVNVATEKAEISKPAVAIGSPENTGKSDLPSEKISNPLLDSVSTVMAVCRSPHNISLSEAGVAAGTDIDKTQPPLLEQQDVMKTSETNFSVCEAKAILPAADSNLQHDRGLNGQDANVSFHVMSKSACSEINVTADIVMTIANPNEEIKSSNEGTDTVFDACSDVEQNAASMKLNHLQSEEVTIEKFNKSTELTENGICSVNGQESFSDVEVNKVVETSLEANPPEKPISLAASKQSLGPSLQLYGRGQSIPTRASARTWHRSSNASSSSVSHPASKIPKSTVTSTFSAGSQRITEVVAAYVRKGNSLVRTSASPVSMGPPLGPVKDAATKVLSNMVRAPRTYSTFRNMMNNAKPTFRQAFTTQKALPNDINQSSTGIDKILLRDSQGVGHPHPSVMLTPAEFDDDANFLLSTKGSGADDQRPKIAASEANNSFLNSTLPQKLGPFNIQSVGEPNRNEMPGSEYLRNKVNPLVASMPLTSSVFAGKAKITVVPSTSTQDVYYKRKNNQLVRNDTGTKNKVLQDQASRRQTHMTWNSTIRKALKRGVYLPSSSVWVRKAGHAQEVNSVLPLLFPWKRQSFGLTVRARRFKSIPSAKKGSLLSFISKRLQRLRKVQPVYSRSAGGFSLHRSAVLSLTGANLKWTKSIEKRSKQASEEATKAVAAVAKQKRKEKEAKAVNLRVKVEKKAARRSTNGRERIVVVGLVRYKMDPSGRTLQRLPGDGTGASHLLYSSDSTILPTPRRLSYDGTAYVRIGNGNQLVRDPKAVSRALANEKVRWSLHSARSRRAKKQQYCLFFTRFGKCNKSEGECPYIHDPEKVAVCTKFLKGTCPGTNCLFSHKAVPERMPDCSFFLEGMCTNEECPYRHVYVNPKAPICEGFLKGFCVDGDECDKKHTRICPDFAVTGECQNKTTCKLHHPKKKGKRAASKTIAKNKNKKRRYFLSGSGLQQLEKVSDNLEYNHDNESIYNETIDFIKVPELSLDFQEIIESSRKFASIKEVLPSLQDCSQKDMDLWIKPILLLGKTIPA